MSPSPDQKPEHPSDGTCIRCSAAPRNASGLCATCVDEDAVRAGEVQAELCSDCPPLVYPTDATRCASCPRQANPAPLPPIFTRSESSEDDASQALWRRALDQERVENDGLEECGNWSATDPVKKDRDHDD